MRLEDYFEFEKCDAKVGVGERIRLKGTRVSLDTVVDGFKKEIAPQEIAEHCPNLTLEQVYAAITYYLHNKTDVDDYIRRGEEMAEAYRQEYLVKGPYFLRDTAAS